MTSSAKTPTSPRLPVAQGPPRYSQPRGQSSEQTERARSCVGTRDAGPRRLVRTRSAGFWDFLFDLRAKWSYKDGVSAPRQPCSDDGNPVIQVQMVAETIRQKAEVCSLSPSECHPSLEKNNNNQAIQILSPHLCSTLFNSSGSIHIPSSKHHPLTITDHPPTFPPHPFPRKTCSAWRSSQVVCSAFESQPQVTSRSAGRRHLARSPVITASMLRSGSSPEGRRSAVLQGHRRVKTWTGSWPGTGGKEKMPR